MRMQTELAVLEFGSQEPEGFFELAFTRRAELAPTKVVSPLLS